MELITLQTKHTTYQMGVTEQGLLLHLYYGAKNKGDLSNTLLYYERGMSGVPYDLHGDNTVSCDVLPQEYPCFGNGDYRSPAFELTKKDGVRGVDFRYRSHQMLDGKYQIPRLPAAYGENGVQTCQILLEAPCTKVQIMLRYGIFFEQDVITRSVEVINRSFEEVVIQKVLSATLEFVTGQYDLLYFHGRHMMERISERVPVGHAKHCVESRRGTSSHQHNPFVILAEQHTTEESGLCYGMSFVYSGNFVVEAEKDQFEQTRLQMGLLNEAFDYHLEPGEKFYAPEVILSCTEKGLSRLSQQFHLFIREHICRGSYQHRRRPILVNNWEATYFDFTGEKLIEIAKQASDLGMEMLVLDDGWFGKRNNDLAGLGDWEVNEEKIGGTLRELSEAIHKEGLQFGLWIEPEMVNEDSNLYRAHPEWVLRIPGKPPVLGRNQLVLDFSRKEVVDYIFQKISFVLDHAKIEYLKMDMNRSICEVYSEMARRQDAGMILYQYVLGVYDFLERLQQTYPALLIEGCSSGGGRFDAGMLYYTPQIWCSDNTDAIERLVIQEGTSYGYPISSVSAHVSAVPNHQTGRNTSMHTRGVVAMAGNLGYELDLTTLDEEEKQEIREQIQAYKEQWELIHYGTYYRVASTMAGDAYGAWAFVNEEKNKALLSVVSAEARANRPIYYAKCPGLKEDGIYHCLETDGVYSGATLRYVGIAIPIVNEEYFARQYHLNEV